MLLEDDIFLEIMKTIFCHFHCLKKKNTFTSLNAKILFSF